MGNTEIALRPEQEAVLLTERIKTNGRAAVNAVCNIGKDLRRMKIEDLFIHLGYNSFEEYAEKEFDLKRRQAYLYISVYEKLGEEFVQANAHLGITKLAMLTQINAEDRAGIIEDNNISKMSTKEFDELLSKYKEQGEQLSLLEDENSELKASIEELKADSDASQEVIDIRREKEEAERRIQALEEKVKKSEEIADNYKNYSDKLLREYEQRGSMLTDRQAEINKLKKEKKELEEAKSANPVIKEVEVPDKKALEAKDKEIEKLKKTVKKLNLELEKQTEKPTDDTEKRSFKAQFTLTYKELVGLIELVKSADDTDKPQFKEKIEELLEVFKKDVELIK